MKALILTGSRADHNCQDMVWGALNEAGHQAALVPFHSLGKGTPVMRDQEVYSARNVVDKLTPDVVVVAGDRIEMLKMTVYFAELGLPICHISGGDVTEGSADDRYRDAITALACIHCTETEVARHRLLTRIPPRGDYVICTGNPALDRIKQTPILDRAATFADFFDYVPKRAILVCVHPNTVSKNPFVENEAVVFALAQVLEADNQLNAIIIGGNKDRVGNHGNEGWKIFAKGKACAGRVAYTDNVKPQLYYSLMTHCDVMVGNSSAMLCEAPMFGLPCVLVGDRQKGRPLPDNIWEATHDNVAVQIEAAMADGHFECVNPYGDGNSAPRVVKALEENAWRWSK